MNRCATSAAAQLIAVIGFIAAWPAAADSSLCKSNEKVVFSCQIKRSHKVAALCGRTDKKGASEQANSLIYRFGTADVSEFEFPKKTEGSLEQFRFFHYFRPGLDSTAVSFENNSYSYTINHTSDSEEGESAVNEMSVMVSSNKKKSNKTFECESAKATTNWYLIDGVVPCEDGDGVPNSCHYDQ